jgi:hypothetical protein
LQIYICVKGEGQVDPHNEGRRDTREILNS